LQSRCFDVEHLRQQYARCFRNIQACRFELNRMFLGVVQHLHSEHSPALAADHCQ
jgi:hypothetical protein